MDWAPPGVQESRNWPVWMWVTQCDSVVSPVPEIEVVECLLSVSSVLEKKKSRDSACLAGLALLKKGLQLHPLLILVVCYRVARTVNHLSRGVNYQFGVDCTLAWPMLLSVVVTKI